MILLCVCVCVFGGCVGREVVAGVAAGGREEWGGSGRREHGLEQREGKKGLKRNGEWRSEGKRRAARRGYCDGNAIRKPDCGAQGSVQVTPSASNLA